MRSNFSILLLIFLFFTVRCYPQNPKYEQVFRETSTTLLSNDPQQALHNTTDLYRMATNNTERIRSCMLRATLLRQHGIRNEAVAALKRADSLAVLDKNYNLQARINGFLSTIYREYEIYSIGKIYLKKAVAAGNRIADKNEKYKFQGTLSQEIAYYEMYAANYSKAITNLKAGKRLFERAESGIDKNFLKAVNDELIAKNYLSLHKTDSAFLYFQQARTELAASESADSPLGGFIINGFANVYARRGEYSKAVANYKKAEEIAIASNFFTLKQEVYSSLVQFYKKTDHKKYIHYNELNLKLSKEEENSRKVGTDDLIKILRKEQLDKQSKFQKGKIIIVIGGVIFVVLAGILLFLYRKKGNSQKVSGASENAEEIKAAGEAEPKTISSKEYMSRATEDAILEKIRKLEETHFYLDKDISLHSVAVMLSINERYISYVIKKNKSKDFAAYINELRIHYITERLKNDSSLLKYKISFLAGLSGFSSHSRFTITFKKVTGESPQNYIGLLQKKHDEQKPGT